jgi:hypothetical protein
MVARDYNVTRTFSWSVKWGFQARYGPDAEVAKKKDGFQKSGEKSRGKWAAAIEEAAGEVGSPKGFQTGSALESRCACYSMSWCAEMSHERI